MDKVDFDGFGAYSPCGCSFRRLPRQEYFLIWAQNAPQQVLGTHSTHVVNLNKLNTAGKDACILTHYQDIKVEGGLNQVYFLH